MTTRNSDNLAGSDNTTVDKRLEKLANDIAERLRIPLNYLESLEISTSEMLDRAKGLALPQAAETFSENFQATLKRISQEEVLESPHPAAGRAAEGYLETYRNYAKSVEEGLMTQLERFSSANSQMKSGYEAMKPIIDKLSVDIDKIAGSLGSLSKEINGFSRFSFKWLDAGVPIGLLIIALIAGVSGGLGYNYASFHTSSHSVAGKPRLIAAP